MGLSPDGCIGFHLHWPPRRCPRNTDKAKACLRGTVSIEAGLPSLATTGSNTGVAESRDLLVNSGVQSDEKEILKKHAAGMTLKLLSAYATVVAANRQDASASKRFTTPECQLQSNVAPNCRATKLIAFPHLLRPPMNYFLLRMHCKPTFHVVQNIYFTDTLCR